jgi:excinuclease UvrABC nuclease subunit
MLTHALAFDPANPRPTLAALPESPGVFALFAADPKAEPYLARTTNLRRRLKRFLDARPAQTKRLQLAARVARVEYAPVGSDFECDLALYNATRQAFGERARRRLRLHAPFFLRMTATNRYPRVYVTNMIAKSAAEHLYGPFPSRAAAERYCDEALNLFQLRRCHEDLAPDPTFPGCVYSEMKMCLAPCFQGCSDERYAEEAAKVQAFLETRGQSLLRELAQERDQASEELDFERAAAVHAKIQKVEAVAAQASEAVRPLARLRAIILQPALPTEGQPGKVAIFQFAAGQLTGPALYDTLGMRMHNEQSGSSSLYTHPYALEAVPLGNPLPSAENEPTEAAPSADQATAAKSLDKPKEKPRDVLEQRLLEALQTLAPHRAKSRPETQTTADHLSLFARWYYRPETKRVGEAVFYALDEPIPAKQVLRAISRVFRATSPVAVAAQSETAANSSVLSSRY